MKKEQKKTVILIIDNDDMMRFYFRDIFWIHGRSDTYEVIMASSIAEAEEKLADKNKIPDSIFLDVMMPVKGENNSPEEQIKRSLSFVERIKKDKELSSIKIIIYSGQKEKLIKDAFCMGSNFCKSGVDGYMVKGELMPKEIIAFVDKIHESNN